MLIQAKITKLGTSASLWDTGFKVDYRILSPFNTMLKLWQLLATLFVNMFQETCITHARRNFKTQVNIASIFRWGHQQEM